MPRIKIFTSNESFSYYDDEYSHTLSDITKWEEVTDEEYRDLRAWADKKNSSKRSGKDMIYILLDLDAKECLKNCVGDYQKFIAEEAQEEKKRKETAAKRKATLAKKKAEKQRLEYEKLKAKFEGGK